MERLTRSHVAGDMLRTSKSSLANGTLVVAPHDVSEDIDRAEKDDGLVLGGYLIPYSNLDHECSNQRRHSPTPP